LQPIPSQIEKEYPLRCPLCQYRFKEATAFHCFRCGVSKKAKLITIYAHDWNRRLCNGCYGRLLSILYSDNCLSPPTDNYLSPVNG